MQSAPNSPQTITIERSVAQTALDHVQRTVEAYEPDCGDPGCDDCTHILRPAVSLRDALAAALAAGEGKENQ